MAIKIKFIQQDSANFVPRVIYNDITKTVSKKANLPKGGDAKTTGLQPDTSFAMTAGLPK